MILRVMIAARDGCLPKVDGHLKQIGYEVQTVNDGLECWTRIQQSPPDVLVIEQGLPWGNADGIIARLRDEQQSAPVSVVLVIDSQTKEQSSERLQAPVVACLSKPIDYNALTDCLVSLSNPAAQAKAAARAVTKQSIRKHENN